MAVGKPIKSGHYAVLDTRLDFDIFDSRLPYTLFIPQETTEALIEEFALELGVEILRGAMAERIVSEIDGVTVFGANERPFELHGLYVVGAYGGEEDDVVYCHFAFNGEIPLPIFSTR